MDVENKSNITISKFITENKEIIYPTLMYITGLFIGSFLMSYSNPANDIFKKIFSIKTGDFASILIFNVGIYLAVFALTVLLGMCLIGFPFISIIPLTIGIEISMKTSFYYLNHPVKGVGYSLLMIAPESAVLLTVLILTISKSSRLSKYIYSLTVKKGDMTEELNLSSYLKNYLIYALVVSVTALLNSVATYLLNSIIHL